MKLTSLLLGVSLAANAALLVTVFRSPNESVPTSTSGGGTHSVKDGAATAPDVATQGPAKRAKARTAVAEASEIAGVVAMPAWSALNTSSLPEMVKQLRAAGYPDRVIRSLVYARLSDESRERRLKLLAEVEETPYWKPGRNFTGGKIAAAQRELYREQAQIVKELLGPGASEDNELSQYFRRRQYGDISPEKAEEAQRVASDYNDLRNDIYAAANGMMMPEDREKLAYLEKEMRSDLAKVLTPAELEGYELRSSSTATSLRSQLTTFSPSEEEFKALFHAAQSVEAQYGSSQGISSYEQMQQRRTAMNELAKQVLAPDRYAEFAQATDPKYQMLNRVVARYELPTTVVPQIAAVQDNIQQRAVALRDLPPAERAEQLSALAAEATAKLTPLLGAKAFEAYKLYGGQWLQQLTRPRPQPPRPTGG